MKQMHMRAFDIVCIAVVVLMAAGLIVLNFVLPPVI